MLGRKKLYALLGVSCLKGGKLISDSNLAILYRLWWRSAEHSSGATWPKKTNKFAVLRQSWGAKIPN